MNGENVKGKGKILSVYPFKTLKNQLISTPELLVKGQGPYDEYFLLSKW